MMIRAGMYRELREILAGTSVSQLDGWMRRHRLRAKKNDTLVCYLALYCKKQTQVDLALTYISHGEVSSLMYYAATARNATIFAHAGLRNKYQRAPRVSNYWRALFPVGEFDPSAVEFVLYLLAVSVPFRQVCGLCAGELLMYPQVQRAVTWWARTALAKIPKELLAIIRSFLIP
jgi:hypothetical protein